MEIALLEMGGTINGILSPEDAAPGESLVSAWLQARRASMCLHFSTRFICMKDSRAINEDDRARLADAIHVEPAHCILIPHGTYTMPETGRYLRQHLDESALRKSIVLVGSLRPLSAPDSDAGATLDFAVNVLRDRPEGVWVVMQSQLWDPARVTKDETTGRYVPAGRSG